MATTREQLRALSDTAVQCRTWRHMWEEFTPPRNKYAWANESLRCARGCGTERHRSITPVGDVEFVEYVYPDTYKLARYFQGDRLTVNELRVEVMRRKRNARRAAPNARARARRGNLTAVR